MRERWAYFWSDWPQVSQERFFRVTTFGIFLITLALLIGLKLFSSTLEQRFFDAKKQYVRVFEIVQDIEALQAQRGDLAHLSKEESLRVIGADIGLQDEALTIHSAKWRGEKEGVSVTMRGLDLSHLAEFMAQIRMRAALQTASCSIGRDTDDTRLVNAVFILVR